MRASKPISVAHGPARTPRAVLGSPTGLASLARPTAIASYSAVGRPPGPAEGGAAGATWVGGAGVALVLLRGAALFFVPGEAAALRSCA